MKNETYTVPPAVMAGVLAKRGNRALIFRGDDGLDELTTALAGKLGDRLRLGARVAQVERVPGGFRLALDQNGRGSTFDAEVSSSFLQWEGQTASQVIITDITRRRQAERSQREMEERYRHLLDVMPQYNAIAAGSWNAATITQLQALRSQDLKDLNSRLNAMSAAIEKITPQINALK